ncbi:hypothetical protein J1605_019302 [Eschrichtius robustus]|uniref:Ubiquitin carboxyl-terminal hydrolase 33 n=1 Tax=Eschrichtius robustus TaxID=9764 RepID=A0AB34HQW5_ESCRO|nr:hypothetical protein J1605_019302 [Eschrichtius robustus]
MSAFRGHCPHLDSVGEITKEDLIQKSHGSCQDCKVRGPNLWACLENRCSYVGCGESQVDHSTIHSQETKHYLTVNLTTLRVWCYACSKEVFLDRKLGTQPSLPHVKPLHQTQENSVQDFKIPSNTTLKTPLVAVFDDLDIEVEEEDELKARGLTGLKNIGNTCYMNAALQALSNCPPLTQFFLDCGGLARTDKKPAICKSYLKLMTELWHKSRPGFVVPTNLFQGIKTVNPAFRGYSQQDAQEFLRCLMDLLHEELKEQVMEVEEDPQTTMTEETVEEEKSQSDADFQSCESCSSSDKAENENGSRSFSEDNNEATMLIQDDENNSEMSKDWQKEKMCNKIIKANSEGELDGDSVSETVDLNNQETVKVQIHSRASAQSASSPKRKKQHKKYRSVISDIFDGTIISSVQCLTCDRVSVTLETFQDLSLPIPGKEDLAKLHSSSHPTSIVKAGSCGEAYAPQGWIAFFMEYVKSWFWGPIVTLQDCLAAFFARDELKGGHYIAYCRNNLNNLWYEFDDQSVTEVSESTVQNAEAYVLFYRYGGGPAVNHLYICHTCQIEAEKIEKRRKVELEIFIRLNRAFQEEDSPATFYCISMQWFREWESFVKGKDGDPPGPIDNTKIAVTKCGNVILRQGADSGQISEETWNFLQSIYGGGPEVILRPPVVHVDPDVVQAEEKIEVETRSL